jgi:hypothetical protein
MDLVGLEAKATHIYIGNLGRYKLLKSIGVLTWAPVESPAGLVSFLSARSISF